jgi:nucleotide-binding universal stress UspA family protein
MFKRIVVASDLSADSIPVLRAALALARAQQAEEVLAVHVIAPWFEARHWEAAPFEDEVRAHRALIRREEEAVALRLRKQIEEAGAGAPQPPIRVAVTPGSPAEGVVAFAAEMKADLILIGTRGRRDTIGSVAERVVRTAGRPVLVFPAGQP